MSGKKARAERKASSYVKPKKVPTSAHRRRSRPDPLGVVDFLEFRRFAEYLGTWPR